MDKDTILGVVEVRTNLAVLSLAVDRLIELQKIENSIPDPPGDYISQIITYKRTFLWDRLAWIDEPIEEVKESDYDDFEEYYEADRMNKIDLSIRKLVHALRQEKEMLPSNRPEKPIETYPAKCPENAVEIEDNLERLLSIRGDFGFSRIYITKKEQARSVVSIKDIRHRLELAFPFLKNKDLHRNDEEPLRHYMISETYAYLFMLEEDLERDLTRWSYSFVIYYLVRRWWWNLFRVKNPQRD